MIKHVYLYKFINKEVAVSVADILKTLSEHMCCIQELEIGLNFTDSDKAFDLIQVASFKTKEDFNEFTNHPYHEEIRKIIKPYIEKGYKVDYKVE